ncbi:MAG TPA: dethiobiotin synthase [Candidatus Bathyarchaeia archaeon]|nr:dethiobiotin synthase [Candidatus Bathyarchaeia archaeon]
MAGPSPWQAPIWLVTGTDTGVGKTYVACGLVRALRARGRRVAVRKPAETGCERRDGVLHPADAAALREAVGGAETLEAICPIRLEEPLAPAVAAARAGRSIEPRSLVESCRRAGATADVLIIEGAGGLLVPLATDYSFADLADELAAGLIVVVGARLGAINHARLTVETARARGLAVEGYVVNHFQPTRDTATATLAETLAPLLDAPCFAEIGFGEDPARALAASALIERTPGGS